MLLSLSLKNFVIVDKLNLDFQSGFTVLTGETGAGKSVTLDALGLLMGDKASTDQIRSGEKEAQLSALFDLTALPHLQQQMQESGLLAEHETQLSIRRTIDVSGRSRNFINDQSVTVSQLKELGEQLIDIHGQNTHQSLNKETTQRQLLDAFAHASPLAKSVKLAYQQWQNAQKTYESARQLSEQTQIEQERLQWQINELSELNLGVDEWLSLNQNQNSLAHSVELIEAATWIEENVSENEHNILKIVHQCQQKLSTLAAIHPNFAQSLDIIHSVEAELTEVAHNMREVSRNTDTDPAELIRTEERMQQIAGLAKKYRIEPENLSEKLSELVHEAKTLEDKADIATLQAVVEQSWQHYLTLTGELTQKRKEAAQSLSVQTTEQMQSLAMNGAQFTVQLSPAATPMASGMEHISYQVAMNQGSVLRPLNKVASGGELSRISLALQVVMSQYTLVPMLIFDEVDAGIGGRVAQVVGKLLRQLGERYQILSITHLPQVAACGEHHWQVSKQVIKGQTLSTIGILNTDQRIHEIARMLAGEEITETTTEHAKEMLGVN